MCLIILCSFINKGSVYQSIEKLGAWLPMRRNFVLRFGFFTFFLSVGMNICIADFFRRLFEESGSEYGINFDDDILICGVQTTPVCFKNCSLDVFVDPSAD